MVKTPKGKINEEVENLAENLKKKISIIEKEIENKEEQIDKIKIQEENKEEQIEFLQKKLDELKEKEETIKLGEDGFYKEIKKIKRTKPYNQINDLEIQRKKLEEKFSDLKNKIEKAIQSI
jgi:chromosome segregation ATPase